VGGLILHQFLNETPFKLPFYSLRLTYIINRGGVTFFACWIAPFFVGLALLEQQEGVVAHLHLRDDYAAERSPKIQSGKAFRPVLWARRQLCKVAFRLFGGP
jgi:hypothetical protein